jgi:hypothetical protein
MHFFFGGPIHKPYDPIYDSLFYKHEYWVLFDTDLLEDSHAKPLVDSPIFLFLQDFDDPNYY